MGDDFSLDDLIASASLARISDGEAAVRAAIRAILNPFSRDVVDGRLRTVKNDATSEQKVHYKERVAEIAKPLVLGEKEVLEKWAGFFPSRCSVQSGTSHVRVNRPGMSKVDMEPVNEEMLKELDVEFKRLPTVEVTATKIKTLARKYAFLTGKWIIFSAWYDVDRTWQKLTRALLDGNLPGVLYLKVSARDDSGMNVNDMDCTKISVVTRDFTDETEARKVAGLVGNLLRAKGGMKYKADIYTRLGIFANNKFRIRPTIYDTSVPAIHVFGRGRGMNMRGQGKRRM